MKNKFILGVIFTIIGFYAILTNFFGFVHFGFEKAEILLISRIEVWILLLLIVLYAKYIEKNQFLIIKEKKKKWWFYPIAVVSIILIITILLNVIVLIENKLGVKSNQKMEQTLMDILCGNKTLLFFTCLTAAVTEELLFRGYILARIREIFKSDWFAVFLSALLFGLVHFGYGDFNRMFFPFIIGLIFGTYYVRYKNISVLIFAHFIMDFYTFYTSCQ